MLGRNLLSYAKALSRRDSLVEMLPTLPGGNPGRRARRAARSRSGAASRSRTCRKGLTAAVLPSLVVVFCGRRPRQQVFLGGQRRAGGGGLRTGPAWLRRWGGAAEAALRPLARGRGAAEGAAHLTAFRRPLDALYGGAAVAEGSCLRCRAIRAPFLADARLSSMRPKARSRSGRSTGSNRPWTSTVG